MTNVLTEIEKRKKLEQIQAWTRNEGAMADRLSQAFELLAAQKRLPVDALSLELTPAETLMQQRFAGWCASKNVRHCPAAPSTVATFLMDANLDHEASLVAVGAIQKLHDRHGLPNPAATLVTRVALETKLQGSKPPRSWKAYEKEQFAYLPADIRYAISKREHERDRVLNIAQTEYAELRKKLNDEKKEHEANKPIENIPQPRATATG
jgi:hypothetical protein